MNRRIAVSLMLALSAGCSGTAGTFTPKAPSAGLAFARDNDGRHKLPVRVRMTVPRRHRGERVPIHPSTISPATQSVAIAVNGASAQVFNATPSSAGCTIGAQGTTCTFAVAAPPGSDTFTVTTYSATGGGGAMLDRGSAIVNIVKGRANSPLITIG